MEAEQHGKQDAPQAAQLDDQLFKSCKMEEIKTPPLEEYWEYLPCQKKFQLNPEDEISLDSIFSAILSLVEPTEVQFHKKCPWEIDAKDMLNDKQALIFEETLYISKLTEVGCKLSEENKVFLQRELKQVGEYCLNVEESYDGYVVYSRSKMMKGKNNARCGHCLKGKYDNKFVLIVEKRMEYDYIDSARVEKTLEARNKDDHKLIAIRETKINNASQKMKAIINIQGREDNFILDGGVMLVTRYLIINNFVGEFEYYSMNLFGKIMRCSFNVKKERKRVKIFQKTFQNTICVINTQYFDDVAQEVSETYYTATGKMVLHFWRGYNYILHCNRAPVKPPEKILPKLELMWRSDNLLSRKYKLEKKLTYENAVEFLTSRPEVADFLHDYILSLLKFKPLNVLDFTVKFFQNMKCTF